MNKHSKLDFSVGIFVIMGFIALVFVAFQAANLSSINFGKKYTIYALFENIGALKVNAPVKSSGVVIGRVSQISLDQQRARARVDIEIDDKYRLPVDSSAKIMTTGLLGDQFISIEFGSDNNMIEAGKAIDDTSSAFQLETLINAFMATQGKSQ